MAQKWHEFHAWTCGACGSEIVILEREDRGLDKAEVFDRVCSLCGAKAPGTTIRPMCTAYRITPRRDWQPRPT